MNRRVLLCDTSPSWGGVQEWMVAVAVGLPAFGWDTTLAGTDNGPIVQRGQSAGATTLSLPGGLLAGSRAMLQLARMVGKEHVDVIVCARGSDLRIAAPAAWRRRIPLVWRVGGRPALGVWQRITKSLIVDHVIVPSQFMHDYLAVKRWDPQKITVVPNGISPRRVPTATDIAAARAALGWQPDEYVVLFVGNLRGVKRVDVLVAAFLSVAARHPQARLVIVGAGPWEERLRAFTPPDSRVHFVGHQLDPSPYYDACDALVLASREETFGWVLLEAMARGKPVVATRVGAIPEVVGADAGLLVEPGDPNVLAAALFRLVESPSLSHQLGEAGVERVQHLFTASLMCKRLADALEAATKMSKVRRHPHPFGVAQGEPGPLPEGEGEGQPLPPGEVDPTVGRSG